MRRAGWTGCSVRALTPPSSGRYSASRCAPEEWSARARHHRVHRSGRTRSSPDRRATRCRSPRRPTVSPCRRRRRTAARRTPDRCSSAMDRCAPMISGSVQLPRTLAVSRRRVLHFGFAATAGGLAPSRSLATCISARPAPTTCMSGTHRRGGSCRRRWSRAPTCRRPSLLTRRSHADSVPR